MLGPRRSVSCTAAGACRACLCDGLCAQPRKTPTAVTTSGEVSTLLRPRMPTARAPGKRNGKKRGSDSDSDAGRKPKPAAGDIERPPTQPLTHAPAATAQLPRAKSADQTATMTSLPASQVLAWRQRLVGGMKGARR
jgi:hypothetical protein